MTPLIYGKDTTYPGIGAGPAPRLTLYGPSTSNSMLMRDSVRYSLVRSSWRTWRRGWVGAEAVTVARRGVRSLSSAWWCPTRWACRMEMLPNAYRYTQLTIQAFATKPEARASLTANWSFVLLAATMTFSIAQG